MSQRVERLKEEFFEAPNAWNLERARLVTQAYREHLTEAPVVQQALALARVLDAKTIFIRDGELLVGNYAARLGDYEIYPEYTFQDVVIRYVHFDFDRELDESDFETDEARREFRSIREFWRGRCMHEIADTVIPAEIQEMRDTREICCNPYGRDEGQGHIVVQYDEVVRKGLRHYIDKARARMEACYATDAQGYHFNRAVVVALEAVVRFAHRYAELAEQLARTEGDPQRKKELETIAENCRRVPEYPAETFWQACQAVWFIHLVMHLEQNGFSISLGRLDQYAYPTFEADLAAGRLDATFAQEILENLFMKCMELTLGGIKISLTQTITICGADVDGHDMTNALSFLCVKADRATRMVQPSLIVRWHRNIDQRMVREVLECVHRGDASIAIINDEGYVAGLTKVGIPKEDAVQYCQAGCSETVIGGKLLGGGISRPIFLIRVLELIMNGGVMPDNNKQMGPVVPRLGEYETWEDFFEAFRKTVCYFGKYVAAGIGMMDRLHVDLRPLPFASALMHRCIERGRSLMEAVDYFHPALGHSDFIPAVNCLAAVKKCVFDDQSISQENLRDALAANFQGFEEVRQLLWNAPKYGNDNEYVDSLVPQVEAVSREAMAPYPPSRKSCYTNGEWVFEMIPRISHVYEGLLTPATPDGRFEKQALAAGNAAYPGTERHGPTALLNSMAKLDGAHWAGGTIGNIRFHESFLKNEEVLEKTQVLINTYFRRGGTHLQMNCVTHEVLEDARAHPENYRDLMVRVGGYVDYFTNLDDASQVDIIRRTVMV
jgi:pyruvate formate-lyase/glycerol dehydratase family glycyl radical enzyme